MNYPRLYNIPITLFLAFSILTGSLIAETCLCGKICTPIVHQESKGKAVNPLSHLRCSSGFCKSCNYENGRSLKMAGYTTPPLKPKALDLYSILPASINFHPAGDVFMDSGSFYSSRAYPSSAIYLINQSFLC